MPLSRREFLKHAGLAAAAIALPDRVLSAAAAGGASSAAPAGRPNVLFVMTDQQSADLMSCRMGKTYLNTPAMDSLAEGGTLFSRAYSPNPLCMPMRASAFSGRYPHETRVTRNADPGVDPKEFVCLGTYFRQAGYETAYFGKWHLCYGKNNTESHGFETLDTNQHDPTAADKAVRWLGQKHEKPWLLVVSFLNPHNICEFARGAQKLSCGDVGPMPPPEKCPPVPANLEPPRGEADTMTLMRRAYHANPLFPVGDFAPDRWRQHRWGYYRMIELVDAQLGRVLTALRQAGAEDNTAIVFTSDHGDCAGAHRFNQKTVFYEESVRVPLIVTQKGRTKKAVCDRLVNTGTDMLVTMLDFAGIAAPPKLPGRSLHPIALGQTPAEWPSYVVSENDLCQTGDVDGVSKPNTQGRMVRSARYKYCLFEKGTLREELYDLEKDPLETVNLAADPACRATVLDHREMLRQFAAKTSDATAAAMLAGDVPPRPFQTGEKRQPEGVPPAGKRRKKA